MVVLAGLSVKVNSATSSRSSIGYTPEIETFRKVDVTDTQSNNHFTYNSQQFLLVLSIIKMSLMCH